MNDPLQDIIDLNRMRDLQKKAIEWEPHMILNESAQLVLDFFKGDIDKTALWFNSPNPQFGGLKPKHIHAEKLLKWIKTTIEKGVSDETI